MFPTKNSLPLATRKKIIAALTPLLADAQDLYGQVKQAHWNVRGASFIALHQLFDTIAGEVNEGVDMIAERIAQLGGSPVGDVRVAAKQSRLKAYPLTAGDTSAHLLALAAAVAGYTTHSRKAVDDTNNAGDAITADMLTEITRGLDKQLWFLEAHSSKK
jgi:starvation-inducible DNA-binding protein